jgi:hypothetical protein
VRSFAIYHFLHIGKTGGNSLRRALAPLIESQTVVFHKHAVRLGDIPGEDQAVVFLRDPVVRFVSGFNSRLRRGRPLRNSQWSKAEANAFDRYPTPRSLADALADGDDAAAESAMRDIAHINRGYGYWLGELEELEDNRDRLAFVGRTETLIDDFARMRDELGFEGADPLPDDSLGSHATPPGYDQTLSEKGEQAIRDWYQEDYQYLKLLTST